MGQRRKVMTVGMVYSRGERTSPGKVKTADERPLREPHKSLFSECMAQRRSEGYLILQRSGLCRIVSPR
jgi:hypothetical protein